MPALDGFSLMWAALRAKSTFMEIGSGNSTFFAKAALLHENRSTRIISIDPAPRAEVDSVCDEIYRKPLEDMDLSVFDELDAGDTLFVDNSHRSFMNSDVTTFMLDVLPRLKPGVQVGIHDIFLPFDYFESWSERGYNEQYLLGCYLLSNPKYFDIQFSNYWISRNKMHHEPLNEIWDQLEGKIRDRLSQSSGASRIRCEITLLLVESRRDLFNIYPIECHHLHASGFRPLRKIPHCCLP